MSSSKHGSDADALEGRRLLRALLSRRDFLGTAGTLAAGVGAFGLAACGGGGDAGGPTGTDGTPVTPPVTPPVQPPTQPPQRQNSPIPEGSKTIGGTVSLPPGSALSLSDLAVDVLTQTAYVSSTGAFTVGISQSGPSLGLLLDKNASPVLMSMFDPASSTYAVSSTTTAAALLFYAVDGFTFPPEQQSRILSLITSDPETAKLGAVIATAVASDAQAIVNGAAPIAPAIAQSLNTMLGLKPAVRAAERVATAAAVPTLMTLQPSGEINGLMIDQDINTTSVLLSNIKRRPGKVYVYRMGTVPNNNTNPVNPDVPATLVRGPFDLPSTERLELFNALKDFTTFFKGKSPWTPVTIPPILLELEENAVRSTYQVVVLTSAFKWVSGDFFEPSFFRAKPFEREVARWRTDTEALFLQTIVGDMMFPMILLMLGAGTIQVSRAVLAQVVASAAQAYRGEFNNVLRNLKYGSLANLREGMIGVIEMAFRDDLAVDIWSRNVQQVISGADARALKAQNLALQGTRLSRAASVFKKVFAPLFALESFFTASDLGAVALDFWGSEIGTTSVALLIRQKLNLRPENPRIGSGERVSFNVTNPANLTGTFEYDWTHTSLFAQFSAQGEANVGKSIRTSKRDVDLVTTGSDRDPITVTVIGYNTITGQRVEIGRAATTVQFLMVAQITPTNPVLSRGQQRVFVVTVDGELPSDVSYRWTLTGSAGSIGASNVVTTTVPRITYTGHQSGSDVLHVDVLDGTGGLLAKADGGVAVIGDPFITITIAGSWTSQQPPNGVYTFTDHRSARFRVPDDASLDALAFGFDFPPGDDTVGLMVTMVVPAGAPITTNQTWTKLQGVLFTPGTWQLTLARDLGHGDPDNRDQRAPAGTGTLRFDALGQLSDGSFVGHYRFSITNAQGGTIVGEGVGKWTNS